MLLGFFKNQVFRFLMAQWFFSYSFVTCRLLDETYVYILVACHVQICGKCDLRK